MLPHERAALDAIRAIYGRPVLYTGAGLTNGPILAIRSDTRAAAHQGFAGRAEGLSFEIEKALIPQHPRKGNLIVEGNGDRWEVNDINDADDVESWVLAVKEAEPEE